MTASQHSVARSATECSLCTRPQVDVYSFSMILYQLFEHQPPFAGTDPVEAARQAALYEYRPPLSQLKGRLEPFPVRCPTLLPPLRTERLLQACGFVRRAHSGARSVAACRLC